MKRTRFLAFVSLPLFLLSTASCDPARSFLDYDEFSEEVVSVDLIDYRNDDQKHFSSWVPDHKADLVPFNVENATLIKTLDESVLPTFVKQVCDYAILVEYFAYDSPKGVCIRMNHKNEDFTILWAKTGRFAGYIGKFSSTGDVKKYYGCYEANYIDGLLRVYFDYPEEQNG